MGYEVDPLSQMLAFARPEAASLLTCDFTAPWGIDVPAGFDQPFFFSILENYCWLWLEESAPIKMQPGDILLTLRGDAHRLASDAAAPKIPWTEIFPPHGRHFSPAEEQAPRKLKYGGGGILTRLVGAVFGFGDPKANSLLAALPRFIYLRNEESKLLPWLRSMLEFMSEETSTPSPGYLVVAQRLADLMFINIIRAHVRLRPHETFRWLRGLSDPGISRALTCIHQKPAEPWTVARLAAQAAMSRAVFAERFHRLTEQSPIEYLTEWRMNLAARRFASSLDSLSSVAEMVGYKSLNAFGQTFRRIHGSLPGQYARAFRNQAGIGKKTGRKKTE